MLRRRERQFYSLISTSPEESHLKLLSLNDIIHLYLLCQGTDDELETPPEVDPSAFVQLG